jgi:aspartyl-tRNA(Asn)/glutamyl-tRNA(Gln) amidotransferase subunit A
LSKGFPSVTQLIDQYRRREVRPSEIIEELRDRVRARQPIVGAFAATRWEQALTEATRADREYRQGTVEGPLAGLPVAVKDVIDTADCVTEYGSPLFAGHLPNRDADVVTALRRAGAIIVGKTITHEFAWGITSLSPHGSRCRNPLDPQRIAGGSSGGSAAAVADEQVPVAIGTDTAGSVRIPAALCGVTGFKPSFGVVSTRGCWPLAASLDHVGLLTKDPLDAMYLNDVLRGASARLHRRARARAAVMPGISTGQRQAIAAAGIETVSDVQIDLEEPYRVLGTIQSFEALNVHRAAGLYPVHEDHYGADVRARLAAATVVTEHAYRRALDARELVRRSLRDAFAQADVLISRPISGEPPRVDTITGSGADSPLRDRLIPGFALQSLLGLPACLIPVPSTGRFPSSLQITGRRGCDPLVLDAAVALSSACRPAEGAAL